MFVLCIFPPHLFLRCCTLPRQRNLPLTMMAILVQSASHSSMLRRDGPNDMLELTAYR